MTDSRYAGDYQRGRRHGKGLYTFASGTTYEGDYVNNAKVSCVPGVVEFFSLASLVRLWQDGMVH